MSVLLTASPATATRIGSPAATTEPNMMQQDDRGREQADAPPSRCRPARPAARVWPPSRPGRRCEEAPSATSSIRWLSSTGMSGGFTTSSRACVRMVVPSGLTRPGPRTGHRPPRRAAPTGEPGQQLVHVPARTAGSWAPASAWMTTSTVSPASDGNRSSSSCWASGVRAGCGVVGLELAAEGASSTERPGRLARRARSGRDGGT